VKESGTTLILVPFALLYIYASDVESHILYYYLFILLVTV